MVKGKTKNCPIKKKITPNNDSPNKIKKNKKSFENLPSVMCQLYFMDSIIPILCLTTDTDAKANLTPK